MKKVILIAAAVIILGVGIGLATTMVNNSKSSVDQIARDATGSSSDTKNTEEDEAASSPAAGSELAVRATITYTNSGFDKDSYTVNVGEGIEIKNNSSRSLDFASDDHPSHTDNSNLNVGTIAAGQTKIFTIEKAGEWGFHNHLFASHEATITVQ